MMLSQKIIEPDLSGGFIFGNNLAVRKALAYFKNRYGTDLVKFEISEENKNHIKGNLFLFYATESGERAVRQLPFDYYPGKHLNEEFQTSPAPVAEPTKPALPKVDPLIQELNLRERINNLPPAMRIPSNLQDQGAIGSNADYRS